MIWLLYAAVGYAAAVVAFVLAWTRVMKSRREEGGN